MLWLIWVGFNMIRNCMYFHETLYAPKSQTPVEGLCKLTTNAEIQAESRVSYIMRIILS